MLETVAVPILLQSVNWLFGECSKILDDRRERRKATQHISPSDASAKPADALGKETSTPTGSSDAIQTREEALRQPVAEAAWQNAESHVMHLLSLLTIHTKNYHLAKEQYAKWGSALVPPIVAHTLAEAEDEIVKTTRELQSTLSLVYRRKVVNPEVDRS